MIFWERTHMMYYLLSSDYLHWKKIAELTDGPLPKVPPYPSVLV